ncbi:MAG: BolA family protein [Geminicoccaceae bacterium]
MTGPVQTSLRQRIEQALQPVGLDIEDQSARHEGHAGARPQGESHFAVTVVSPAFAGMSRVARQRAVLDAVGDLMRSEIHALSITARAPGE